MSRERGRQMSRGPVQPGRWRREVRASGRSLPGSEVPSDSPPPGREARGCPRPQKPRLGPQNPRGRNKILDGARGCGAEKGSQARDAKPKVCNLGKGGMKVGKEAKKKRAAIRGKKGEGAGEKEREFLENKIVGTWIRKMGSERNPVAMGRRARTPLPPVLETRRGWGSAAFSRLDGAGCWASHPGGGERPARARLARVGAGGAPGALRRRLPPWRWPETSARARGANAARLSELGRGEGPTRQGRGTGRSFRNYPRRQRIIVVAEFISPS